MIAPEKNADLPLTGESSSEMRYDWLADRWVIMAPQRTARPNDFELATPHIKDDSECPFCVGHEAETPTAVATYRTSDANEMDWNVRVVPNKFPAVQTGADALGQLGLNSASDATNQASSIELFQRRELSGGHEVFIESPRHVMSLTDLDRKEVATVFQAYRDRLGYWLTTGGCQYAVVFKNVGQDAGASLSHSHSQLISTNVIPTQVDRSIKRMEHFESTEGNCVFCQMLTNELQNRVRIVEETPDFVAFCPFASRTPSLVHILPRTHRARFEELENQDVEQLSWLSHRLLRRVEKCFPDSAYNFVIQTAPRRLDNPASFHWRIELFPRLTKVAGFEWGSDCYINPITPEVAANQLRQAGV
ncbi:MAG: DUF4921 family protein [Pirellulaceae bacterium]